MTSPGAGEKPTAPPPSRREQVLVVAGLITLAASLRPAVTGLGAVLGDIRADLGIGGLLAGVLTTLPVLCFAGVGALTHPLTHRVGVHRTALIALVTVAAGSALRSLSDTPVLFTIGTTVALAGMAVGNVSLPPMVKLHFPDRIPTMTAVYSCALMAGAAVPAGLTVPISDAGGSWRYGLGLWAVMAALAALPWLWLLRHDVTEADRRVSLSPRLLVRSRMAWAMAVFFGLQSAQAYAQFGWLPSMYEDAGLSRQAAALMLTVTALVGVPAPLLLPAYARRTNDHRLLVLGFAVVTAVGVARADPGADDRAVAVGGAARARRRLVPLDARDDRPAHPQHGRHGRAVQLRAESRLPAGCGRAVRHRAAVRPHRRLDGAAGGAHRPDRADAVDRSAVRAAATARGRPGQERGRRQTAEPYVPTGRRRRPRQPPATERSSSVASVSTSTSSSAPSRITGHARCCRWRSSGPAAASRPASCSRSRKRGVLGEQRVVERRTPPSSIAGPGRCSRAYQRSFAAVLRRPHPVVVAIEHLLHAACVAVRAAGVGQPLPPGVVQRHQHLVPLRGERDREVGGAVGFLTRVPAQPDPVRRLPLQHLGPAPTLA